MWLFLLRKSKLALIIFGFCAFYYGTQLDYFYFFEGLRTDNLFYAYLYYYASTYLLFIIFLFILARLTYKPPLFPKFNLSHRIAAKIISALAILIALYIIDLSSLFTLSRPAMTDFGYLSSMLLFVSVFLCLGSGSYLLASIQMLFLLFLSKLLFFLLIIYAICTSNKIKGFYLYVILLCSIGLFFGWGVYQDNMNYDGSSDSINQFITLDFFFRNVIEGGTSIITQVERTQIPDFGSSMIVSGILRLLPGSILRQYGINLVPEGISNSIVISGIESSIIHFKYLAPFFFSGLVSLLFYIFNCSGSQAIKFISCVSIFFFIRSGSYSFINNLIVMMAIFFIWRFLSLLINQFIVKRSGALGRVSVQDNRLLVPRT